VLAAHLTPKLRPAQRGHGAVKVWMHIHADTLPLPALRPSPGGPLPTVRTLPDSVNADDCYLMVTGGVLLGGVRSALSPSLGCGRHPHHTQLTPPPHMIGTHDGRCRWTN
jgi:hypothetical protein